MTREEKLAQALAEQIKGMRVQDIRKLIQASRNSLIIKK